MTDTFARAFDAGEVAAYAGLPRHANPHRGPKASQAHRGWDSGWLYGEGRLAERAALAAGRIAA